MFHRHYAKRDHGLHSSRASGGEARSALIQFSGSSLVAHFSSVTRMHESEFVSGLG